MKSLAAFIFSTGLVERAVAHASIFHPSMWGFNVTGDTFPYDNRAVAPLTDYTFDQWWFHGHLDFPPHPEDVFSLPAGGKVTTEITCDKGVTSFADNPPDGDDVCPNSTLAEFHTTGFDDLKGCGLAIAYKSDASEVQPEDFTVFSVNQTCVWTRFTDFEIPDRMPECPGGKCICAWFWIHSPDSGSEQNYMTAFQCNITGATSTVPLAKPQVPRRCGLDLDNGKELASVSNCTYGAKQPLYWLQSERNNVFEGPHAPPFYNDLYNFLDGPQNDIFEDSYLELPIPSPVAALPVLNLTLAAVASGLDGVLGSLGLGGLGGGLGGLLNGTIPGEGAQQPQQGGGGIVINLNSPTNHALGAATNSEPSLLSRTGPGSNARPQEKQKKKKVERDGWKRSRIAAHMYNRRRGAEVNRMAWVLGEWRKEV
ncbi:hypothetical protein D9757_013863 [Collybiopsis confluens]|uniref:Lytic polysaccharide monooxygenase n=1 Tax=Collybiopsis confluens TaxID=2823264 RepID=A0A8H5FYM8_9AGAR|nr:hypothetical protein D9757_013863 [Collybiopsis confluens]